MQIFQVLYRPGRYRIAKNNFRPGGECFSPASFPPSSCAHLRNVSLATHLSRSSASIIDRFLRNPSFPARPPRETSPRREVLRFGELTASRLMKAAEFKRCVDATFDDQELQQLNRFGERTSAHVDARRCAHTLSDDEESSG